MSLILKSKQLFLNKKIIVALTVVIITGITVGGAYFISQKNSEKPDMIGVQNPQDPENKVNYNPPTEAEKQATEQQKQEIINKSTSPPVSDALSVSIIRANQTDRGEPLTVRALVNGTISGTCAITFTRSGSPTVKKGFPVSFEATSATCSGANIAASEFSVSGEWDMSVVVTSSNSSSSPAKMLVNINK